MLMDNNLMKYNSHNMKMMKDEVRMVVVVEEDDDAKEGELAQDKMLYYNKLLSGFVKNIMGNDLMLKALAIHDYNGTNYDMVNPLVFN